MRFGVAIQIEHCFEHAIWADHQHYPYVFAGGHPGFKASKGGYDCSGWVSAILDAGGILGHPEALGTHELEHWGLPGPGQYMTVWVRNGGGVEHTFIEFRIPKHLDLRWSVAPHTGDVCGWKHSVDLKGYQPRRRAA